MSGVLHFPPGSDVVRLVVYVWGPGGNVEPVHMILDTGASFVVLRPHVAIRLGYDLSACPRQTVHSAHRGEDVPRFSLASVKALGHAVNNVGAITLDLPPPLGADGLLGNTFLRRFDIELSFARGILRLTPVA